MVNVYSSGPLPCRLGSGKETDQPVDLQLIWEELDNVMSKHKIKSWSMQKVQKKYCFEKLEVPVEADWIEVNYPFSCKLVVFDGTTLSL